MKFILDPDSPRQKYWLRKASLDKIFELVTFAPLEAKREKEALDFIKTYHNVLEIYAPFIPAFYKDLSILRFEGKHRLYALRTLGYKEIAIGVPKKINLSTLEFLI